jgi:uncharacterized alkaline shock family protein YloU
LAGNFTTTLGRVEISDAVIAIIAGTAASECYGLVGMAARNVQDGLIDLLRQEHYERGVEVEAKGEELIIRLHIVVEYGTKISEVAHNVMQRVKYAVETTCGIPVQRVDVRVEGVRVTRPQDER